MYTSRTKASRTLTVHLLDWEMQDGELNLHIKWKSGQDNDT